VGIFCYRLRTTYPARLHCVVAWTLLDHGTAVLHLIDILYKVRVIQASYIIATNGH
jgi:hypothetical protein